jgi:HPt (histidine-containing phosphotransfer) domain-containing protein
MTDLQSALDSAVLDELRKSVGYDSEFLAELIDTFVADAPAQLEALRRCAVSGDAAGARRAAHTLKGNGLTFGARELASLCQEAESAAEAGDLEAVLAQVDGIDREWLRVQAELIADRDDR